MEETAIRLQDMGVRVETGVSARKLSTFGAGGMVRYLVLPATCEQLQTCLRLLSSVRYHVLGAGSNTLISDFGLQWVVCLRDLVGIEPIGDLLQVGAGVSLPVLAKYALSIGKTGLEFASGIPASVGGALKMNAGAYSQDMASVVDSAYLVTADGGNWVDKERLQLRYRASSFAGIAAKVRFRLASADPDKIAAKMEDMRVSRARRQPHLPSLGCVFKAVSGTPAAKYIEGCGLKGTRIGQAQISGLHCNFIVNMGGATSRDYLRLAEKAKDAVYQRYGVQLQEEFIHIHD